jgi:hypothetical protein
MTPQVTLQVTKPAKGLRAATRTILAVVALMISGTAQADSPAIDDIAKCVFSQQAMATPLGQMGLVKWETPPTMVVVNLSRFDGAKLATALRGMRAEVKQFAGVDVRVADKSALTYEATDRNSMTVFLDETSTVESLKFVNPFYTGLYPDRTSIVEAVRSLLSGSDTILSDYNIDQKGTLGAMRGNFNIIRTDLSSSEDVVHGLASAFANMLLPHLRYTDCPIVEPSFGITGRYFTDTFTVILKTLYRPNIHPGDDLEKIRAVLSEP